MDPYLEIQMSEDEREYNKRRMATPSGTEGSAEQLNPDEYYGNAKLFAEVLNYENALKRENADLRQRLQDVERERDAEINHLKNAVQLYEDAKREILRLKEELLTMAGILTDEDGLEGYCLSCRQGNHAHHKHLQYGCPACQCNVGDTLPAKEKA